MFFGGLALNGDGDSVYTSKKTSTCDHLLIRSASWEVFLPMVSRHFFNGILLGLHTGNHQPGQEQIVEASFHLVNNILYMQIHREISVRKLLPSSHDHDERYSNNFIFYGNVQQKQSRSLLQISSLLPLNDQRNSSYYSAQH